MAIDHLNFQKNKIKDMSVYQSNPMQYECECECKHLRWVCYIFCAQKSRPAKGKVHISKAALVLVQREGVRNMQPNYSFLFN